MAGGKRRKPSSTTTATTTQPQNTPGPEIIEAVNPENDGKQSQGTQAGAGKSNWKCDRISEEQKDVAHKQCRCQACEADSHAQAHIYEPYVDMVTPSFEIHDGTTVS